MKKSLLTLGITHQRFGMCGFVLAAALALGAVAAPAQMGGAVGNAPQNSFVGTWRGVTGAMTVTLVVQANGQYVMTEQSGTLMTQQTGSCKLFSPNTIVFTVTNWAPRTMPVYHALPNGGGYYTQEATTKPPDGSYAYVFQGPNTVVLTDEVMHGTITMNRVQ